MHAVQLIFSILFTGSWIQAKVKLKLISTVEIFSSFNISNVCSVFNVLLIVSLKLGEGRDTEQRGGEREIVKWLETKNDTEPQMDQNQESSTSWNRDKQIKK